MLFIRFNNRYNLIKDNIDMKKNYKILNHSNIITRYFKTLKLLKFSKKNLKIKDIQKIIMIDPLKAKKILEINRINNRLYKYLTIFLGQNINYVNVDSFFELEIKKNIRSVFNYFNYITEWNRVQNAFKILNSYFDSKNLAGVQPINNIFPLYVNNIETVQKKSIDSNTLCTKKVTVIMTVHNEEQLIEYSLNSLFEQTYQNIEVIAVDDASEDNTHGLLMKAKEGLGDRLKVITLKSNCGTYIARNIGIKYATGEFITFHDADDWAHPQRIEEHVKIHQMLPKIKVTVSKLVRIKPDGMFFSKHVYPLDRLCMVSLMIDRSIVDELGFFRSNRTGSDTEYFERVKTFSQYKVARINKVLTFCAHRPNSLTTDPKTGVSGFGENPKRVYYMNRWKQWHQKMLKAKRTPFVKFDVSKYSYSLDTKAE